MLLFIIRSRNKRSTEGMYICTWFMCLTLTAKMALFIGLEHSDNTNTLEQGRCSRKD